MNANERFEVMATLFYSETGIMAPGKDIPAGFNELDYEQRVEAWRVWAEKFYSKLFKDNFSNVEEA